jgi:DNA-directed RNA polymerase specialized sigma24 family protein/tetratricopeptide (TPR) repeat protein
MGHHPAESGSELEWMLHNSHIDQPALAAELANAYYGLLFQFAYLYTRQPSVADAAARSALRQAVVHPHRYTGEIRLRTWLLANTFRACRTLLWQFYIGRMVGGGLKDVQPFFLDLQPEKKQNGTAVPKLVESLQTRDDRARSLVFLAMSAGLSVIEIAVVMSALPHQVIKNLERILQDSYQVMWAGQDLPSAHPAYMNQARLSVIGLLEAEEQAALDVHLVQCSSCREYSQRMAELTIQLREAALSALPSLRFPSDTDTSALATVISSKGGQKNAGEKPSLSNKEILIGLAALGLAFVLTWYGIGFRVDNTRPILPTLSPTPAAVNISILRITSTPGEPPIYVESLPTPPAAQTPTSPFPVFIRFGDDLVEDLDVSGPQVWSTSGPVALSLVLRYWGWEADHNLTLEQLKPNSSDVTVQPYELISFAEDWAGMKAIYRQGGNSVLLSKLVNSGYPVIIQKGIDSPGRNGWYGHYQVVYGYNDKERTFLLQSNFEEESDGEVHSPLLTAHWKSFNYGFIVIVPPGQESALSSILEAYTNETYASSEAARAASTEIYSATSNRARFFSWFNRATSLAYLEDYGGAAKAYDEARIFFDKIPEDQKPWRIFWYQTRPYWAYYYSGRYGDVVDLANLVMEWSSEAGAEESLYWRGLAREALGDRSGALEDLGEAIRINPNFTAGKLNLQRLKGDT